MIRSGSPHCQGGWWGSADVRRSPLAQVSAMCGCQGTSTNDRERRSLATTVAPRPNRLIDVMSAAESTIGRGMTAACS